MTPDLINGIFEAGLAVMITNNIRRLYKDKQVKGVSLLTVVWVTAWGFWNLYFYPAVDAWFSFYAGIAVVLANATWLGLALYYVRRRPNLLEATGPALDALGDTLDVRRHPGETDRSYRARIHDRACMMGGCP